MPTAQARISTERAGRYLVQLCEHLDQLTSRGHGHRGAARAHRGPDLRSVRWSDDHGVIEFAFGRCDLRAADDALVIELTADDAAALQKLQDLLTKRIELIGRRDNLAVTW